MKKLFALLLALVLVFSLAACGSSNNEGGSEESGESAEKKVAVFNYNSMNAAANPIMEGMVDVIEELRNQFSKTDISMYLLCAFSHFFGKNIP